ncbi:MAG: hypothetical protein NAG76_18075 [Candidatus Pristimantibacillus lignocellulolyticus]|uniref:Uncharacterized protein n=1 Tax=Candidatus Pristimantibacillus lignocellulolyticus TaxID=2994561 RepID=A0A9J6ZC82_9BACL|nr:MAG: hypothetical protein NAG76_18075 [Candidatus Pristimantibacillus lignocellulolyticus]
MRNIACLLILLLALTGCSRESQSTINEKIDKPSEGITLTPVDLFKGEAAKFKPFLGTMSGAFKLRYDGEAPNVNLDIDIWKNGEKVESKGSLIGLFGNTENPESNEVELIISINTISTEGQEDINQVKVSTVHASGSSTSTFEFPGDKELTLKGIMDIQEVSTFTTESPIPVWGMQATSGNFISTLDFSPESLSKLEYAILFTLKFED